MKKCLNGHEVSDNVKFCPKCGAEIVDSGAKFCAKCGNERKGTEKFCPKCGTPYGQSSTSNVSDTNIGQDKSSKKGILIASVVAVIALIGGAAWYFLGNQQDKYSLEGLAKASVNYDYIDNFHEGLAMVTKGDKYGFIDKMGNEVIPCIYDIMEYTDCSFHEGLAFVRQGDSGYFINKEGKKAFDFKYDAANHFSDGLAIVRKDGKTGYIDTKGNEVIALSDKYAYYDFSEGLAAVGKDGKYGFIDKSGNLVIPINYDDIGDMDSEPYFHEGLSAVCKNEKYGYIDKSGKEVIPFKYTYAHDFSEGLAVVKQNDKWGFIDKNGSIVIPCVFDEPAVFSEGYAAVSKDGKYYIIDKNGKEVFSLSAYTTGYGDAIFHEGFAPVFRKNGDSHVCGFVDTSGKEVIPCVYTNWPSFSEGLAVVEKDGIYGFIDKKGNSTFDIQSEEVKNVVQAKIEEKEKLRKEEEERQAEEERKRIEEQNKGVVELYKRALSSPNNQIAYSCERSYRENSSNRELITYALYLYPRDESSGEAHFVQFRAMINYNYENKFTWVEERYYEYFSGTNYYCIARYEARNGELFVYNINNPVKDGFSDELIELNFEVAYDANSLKLTRKGLHFRRGFETSAPKDPFINR